MAVGLSYVTFTKGWIFGSHVVGSWVAWPRAGASNADPYTKARAANLGLWALGEDVGIQFVAKTDANDDILLANCDYRIFGKVPSSSLWTLHAQSLNGTIISQGATSASVHSRNLIRKSDGSFVLSLSKNIHPVNWLGLTGYGSFELVLNIYDTAPIGTTIGERINFPKIVRQSCS